VDLAEKRPFNGERIVRPCRSERSLKPTPKYLGRAEEVRDHGMRMHTCNMGKGWTGSWRLMCRSAAGNGLPSLQVLCHFISVMIVMFFFTLLILCFTWVESICLRLVFPCNLVYLFV